MKFLLGLVCALVPLSSAFAPPNPDLNFQVNNKEVDIDFSEFEDKALESSLGDGVIVAKMNDFADTILANIGTMARKAGLDPMPLDGFDDNFLVARVKLSEGAISGVSRVQRDGDVTASYSTTTKKLVVQVPIAFQSVGFSYEFFVSLLLIGHTGHLTGNIDNMRVIAEITIDFSCYQASLTKLNMMDTGKCSLHVDGGIIEAVVSILSDVIATVIHPLICAVIQELVRNVLNIIINTINSGIDHILHPDTAAALTFDYLYK